MRGILLLPPAGRLCRSADDCLRLALADQSLRQESVDSLRDGRNVLAVVLPAAAGTRRAFTRRQLVNATAVAIHNRAGWSIRAGIHGVRHSVEIRILRTYLDVLEDSRSVVGRITGAAILDRYVAADFCAGDNALLEIVEKLYWAFQTGG